MEMALRAAALPAGSEFFSSWLKAGQSHDHSAPEKSLRNYTPSFFAPEDFQALQSFTEILIPTDETPGAREAYCAHYIDFVLQSSEFVPKSQESWRNAMKAIRETGFYRSGRERQVELVKEMARPETDPSAEHPAYFAYRLIKQQTVFAFYTSRQGLIETLDYKGNSYNVVFPGCTHPEHHAV
jgi:hypothetical protein